MLIYFFRLLGLRSSTVPFYSNSRLILVSKCRRPSWYRAPDRWPLTTSCLPWFGPTSPPARVSPTVSAGWSLLTQPDDLHPVQTANQRLGLLWSVKSGHSDNGWLDPGGRRPSVVGDTRGQGKALILPITEEVPALLFPLLQHTTHPPTTYHYWLLNTLVTDI